MQSLLNKRCIKCGTDRAPFGYTLPAEAVPKGVTPPPRQTVWLCGPHNKDLEAKYPTTLQQMDVLQTILQKRNKADKSKD